MLATITASLLYLLVSLALLFQSKFKQFTWASLVVALVAHAYQIIVDLPPLPNFEIMRMVSFIALAMNVVAIGVALLKSDSMACMVTVGVSAVLVWAPLIFPGHGNEKLGWEIKLHASLSIAAYMAISFAALYALVLLVQDYKLRHRGSLESIRLPLDYVERMMFTATVAGEVLLTLSLLSGLLFISDIFQQHIVHKLFFSLCAWVIIGSLLLRQQLVGLRDRVAALWLLSGFVFLVLAYFGSNIVLQLILQE